MRQNERSSSARNALFHFIPVFYFLIIESMGDLSYLESFCDLLCLQFFRTLFSLPRDSSAKRERVLRSKGLTLRPKGNEQRNDKMRCPGHPPYRKKGRRFWACSPPPLVEWCLFGGVPLESGLEALALPTSRLLMAVGHDYYKKVKMNLSISHGGVCIFMLGILLS
ncbi:hypothetical protein VPH35_055129 [Triticum aestivum]|uniref:Uncharacterized protein n=1 Tax=Triticum turgidum subsp. durum TaxID=4567 RepID=A0A9R1S938_TRITD|nr:unnamed protein product [Triticum turgidum subsp. durum]